MWQVYRHLILDILHLIYVCVKSKENVAILRKLQFVSMAQHLADTNKHDSDVVVWALITMSFIMTEEDSKLVRLSEGN